MENKSDYNEVRSRIDELVPSPYQSNALKSLMENTVNRFLTKKETEYVDGFIGKRNNKAVTSRQLPEDDIISQANQLQPVLSTTLGSEKKYMSWSDVMNELRLQGVSFDEFDKWGATEKYNWVPPIDIDKLIHFRDYFWVGGDSRNPPEYITIQSICNLAIAKAKSFERMVTRYGDDFKIESLVKLKEDSIFTIRRINSSNNTIRVNGDITQTISTGDSFRVQNTVSNNSEFKALSVVYDSTPANNWTTITVEPDTLSGVETIGQIRYSQYNGIVVDGEMTELFESGFVFFVRNSGNDGINGKFVSVISSEFNSETDKTSIVINENFTESNISGEISLSEQIDIANGVVACECGTVSGFALGLFDDNSNWSSTESGQVIESFSHDNDPVNDGVEGQLWYSLSSKKLFAFKKNDASNQSEQPSWKILYDKFDRIIQSITGDELYDFSSTCNTLVPDSESQWSSKNKWTHRTDVDNFASARQANHPIIEFSRGLELNEYLELRHSWKYRKFNSSKFIKTSSQPTLIELKELSIVAVTNAGKDIILDKYCGDLTSLFIKDYEFLNQNSQQFKTQESFYRKDPNTNEYNTYVRIYETTSISESTKLVPKYTSLGDAWVGYNRHWLYDGINEEVPAPTLAPSPLGRISDSEPTITSNSNYDYKEGEYAQEFIVKNTSNREFEFSSSNLRDKIVVNSNDLRVYINEQRQYGRYEELIDPATNQFVIGVRFDASVTLSPLDVIRIDIAPPILSDHGFTNIPVRTEPNNDIFNASPELKVTSLVRYQKLEQIKTQVNQYPQFNLYRVDGTGANDAKPLFEFVIDQTANIAREIGKRVKVDALTENYHFKQNLLTESGKLLAYKEIAEKDYRVDTTTNTVYKNVDFVWVEKFLQNGIYNTATVMAETPSNPFEGMIWFNTKSNELKEYKDQEFQILDSVEVTEGSDTLRTIWRKSEEVYRPQKKDWRGRTENEYNTERNEFIKSRKELLAFENPDFDDNQLEKEALRIWINRQKNKLSPSGAWVGDWTLPDYFYFNVENENRQNITTRELVGHFEDIINNQDKIPGYLGDKRSQFHVLSNDEVNLGRGGKIHQYNNNFSTFLSSVFVDNIIVPDLIEFAQNQYQVTLDAAHKLAINSLYDVITTNRLTSSKLSNTISNYLRDKLSENSNLEFIYGDSTSYDRLSDVGVRNWVATLPNFGFVNPVRPFANIDRTLGIYELTHHDGHRDSYKLSVDRNKLLFESIKAKFNNSDFGVVSTADLPETYSQLRVETTKDLANGFVWIDDKNKKIYILDIDFIQDNDPTPRAVEGSIWMDITESNGTLKFAENDEWKIASSENDDRLFDGTSLDNSNHSAWTEIDINELIVSSLEQLELSLFEQSKNKEVEFDTIGDRENYFSSYINNTGNELPFSNTDYNPIDAFTWNYKNSITGTKFNLQNIDLANNSFIVDQLVGSVMNPGKKFYIKNSGANDGTWTVLSATENLSSQTTEIIVQEKITEFSLGIMYAGTLPSPNNTGGESAAYWKSLYAQVYGTPYPHLEPWKLQGYSDRPQWWNDEYQNRDNSNVVRRWKYDSTTDVGMWKNIRIGKVPAGKSLPNGEPSSGASGEVKQYSYFSVNTSNNTITSDGGVTKYAPDDLLPPFFDHSAVDSSTPINTTTRSLFSDFVFEVSAPNSNFKFGDMSVYEYNWINSSQYLYDILIDSYKNDPINFMVKTFGFDYSIVDGLLVNKETEKVPSNKNTVFHGSIVGDNIVKVRGLNQWYINYNRYTGTDTNFSSFLNYWKQWSAPLAYQFNSFIDVRTFDVTNSN